jgi:hypothetical protein
MLPTTGSWRKIRELFDGPGKVEPVFAEAVDVKFIGGCSLGAIAAMRCASEPTVQRNRQKARLDLHRKIRADLPLWGIYVDTQLGAMAVAKSVSRSSACHDRRRA